MEPEISEPDPSPVDRAADDTEGSGGGPSLLGVYGGVVVDNQDPAQQGRVLVRSPVLDGPKGGERGLWARVGVPRAGPQRGTWLVPDVGDEVLVAFEAGDRSRPVVIGSLWGAAHTPPEQMLAGNPITSIVSAAGTRITVDDRSDHLSIRLQTPAGRSVMLRDGDGTVSIDDGSGGSVTMTPAGVEIRSAGVVKLAASSVEVSAAVVTITSGMTRANGVVKCNTLVADSVVASSYTPGAGNLW